MNEKVESKEVKSEVELSTVYRKKKESNGSSLNLV